ncbi:hypothetical protein, partial [Pseudomonas floridensis]|uniref:hypothetical protein n=1 Tax=Pseudomonas floridensis TaxID=1958950 RepID=UPI001AC0014F
MVVTPANSKKPFQLNIFFARSITRSRPENRVIDRWMTRRAMRDGVFSSRFLFHELYYSEDLHSRVITHKRLNFLTLNGEPADIHKVVSTNSRAKNRRFDNLLATLEQNPSPRCFFDSALRHHST